MNEIISDSLKKIINDPQSTKVLATTDKNGVPHVVFKSSIVVTEEGYIKYFEIIESSTTNKNMTNSIWHDKWVSVNVLSGEQSYQIKGKIYRAVIYGDEFEKDYVYVRDVLKEDLSTVWLIKPLKITDETLSIRSAYERELHPLLRHLDQV